MARDFLTGIDETLAALTAVTETARPDRLCPLLLRSALDHPLVHAASQGDPDLTGLIARYPLSRRMISRFGRGVGGVELLQVWRRHGMARTDWPLDDQVIALQALAAGFADIELRHDVGVAPADLLGRVFPAAITALLGPDCSDAAGLQAAAAEMLELFRAVRAGVQSLIDAPV